MEKILIKLNYHSMVDVITNSSSEIFCQITSKEFLTQIKEELEVVFGRTISIDDYSEEPETDKSINFWIEYGDNETITGDFIKLLEYTLNNLVGPNNYKINTDVPL